MADLEAFAGLRREIRLDSSSGKPAYLLVGRSGAHIRLSASAYNLVQAARSGLSWDHLAEALGHRKGRKVSAEDLEASYEQVVERLAEIDGRAPTGPLPAGFWLRWRLLPHSLVRRLAARLAGAFAPRQALLLMGFVGLILAAALWSGPTANLGSSVFWPAYGLFTLSLIAHELGHVSACRRYGARPNDIGFTVYWIFPAFYSDVTTAWQLERRHRVIVDLGGVFFQLVVGACYWLAFLATGWRAFETALVMILYACLFSLNPIFKFDGYWMLADALGVTHLSRQPRRVLRHLADRARGRAAAPLPWPPWVSWILFLYTPLSIGFWAYFTARLAPEVWRRALALPEQAVGVADDLARFHAPDWSTVHSLVISTFLLLISGLMIRHLAARLRSAAVRRREPSRPAEPAAGPAAEGRVRLPGFQITGESGKV